MRQTVLYGPRDVRFEDGEAGKLSFRKHWEPAELLFRCLRGLARDRYVRLKQYATFYE